MAGAGRLAMSALSLRNRPKGARNQGLQEEGRESQEGGSRGQMERLSLPQSTEGGGRCTKGLPDWMGIISATSLQVRSLKSDLLESH